MTEPAGKWSNTGHGDQVGGREPARLFERIQFGSNGRLRRREHGDIGGCSQVNYCSSLCKCAYA